MELSQREGSGGANKGPHIRKWPGESGDRSFESDDNGHCCREFKHDSIWLSTEWTVVLKMSLYFSHPQSPKIRTVKWIKVSLENFVAKLGARFVSMLFQNSLCQMRRELPAPRKLFTPSLHRFLHKLLRPIKRWRPHRKC